jgi:hypothetical protein
VGPFQHYKWQLKWRSSSKGGSKSAAELAKAAVAQWQWRSDSASECGSKGSSASKGGSARKFGSASQAAAVQRLQQQSQQRQRQHQ